MKKLFLVLMIGCFTDSIFSAHKDRSVRARVRKTDNEAIMQKIEELTDRITYFGKSLAKIGVSSDAILREVEGTYDFRQLMLIQYSLGLDEFNGLIRKIDEKKKKALVRDNTKSRLKKLFLDGFELGEQLLRDGFSEEHAILQVSMSASYKEILRLREQCPYFQEISDDLKKEGLLRR